MTKAEGMRPEVRRVSGKEMMSRLALLGEPPSPRHPWVIHPFISKTRSSRCASVTLWMGVYRCVHPGD